MASSIRLPFLIICFCCCYGHAKSFVKVVCDETSIGQVGHQSMLTCKVETTQETNGLTITVVVWKKKGDDQFLSVLDKRDGNENILQPGYKVALNNRTISLVITDTKVKDEGEYTCQVATDSGHAIESTNFKVTAKYHPPTANISDEKGIPKSLFCKATGGYPAGKLRWFDENQTEWTKSAKLTVNQMEDGLSELSSELLLKTGSTFSEYTCVVYNASDNREDSVAVKLKSTGPEPSKQLSEIIAPVLVVGSLIVGLLLVLLICRKRSQRTHDMVPHSNQEIDPPPPYYEEVKDSMA
ncbi:cell adhesion molecule 2-like isoform X2 [Xiphophorus maculatus]|uniref:Cell adhesion molecule 2-like n=1 Tax=Xiphophorus maculatus TaxID=8083 RepID=A0A3B5PP01_XIPMA|nr:cell adhesion molecule 2-like isoform X2 [Xiphophorus maculatus]